MFLTATHKKPEVGAERAMQFRRRVTRHVETTAARWAIFRERGDEHVSARMHHPAHLGKVPQAVGWVDEEMKDGAIVPQVQPTRCRDQP